MGRVICDVCGDSFEAQHRRHLVCSEDCAIKLSAKRRYARDAKALRAKRASTRKSGPAHQAQKAVNAFVLQRDIDLPCIVHGSACKHDTFDAGHFVSVSENPALRFDTRNIFKQCRPSNRGAHYRKRFKNAVSDDFERGVRGRYGLERIEWLRGLHEPREYSVEQLKRIAALFNRRRKQYAKRGL